MASVDFRHTAVLLEECIEYLNIKRDGIYIDGTLGGGGHAGAICEKLGPAGVFIGIDRDKDAILASEARLEPYPCKKVFVKNNYKEISSILRELETEKADGAILDLGVSSFQLDNADRGFSYMAKAPLDMRMDAEDNFTAYDVVNTYSVADLSDIIRRYGEERWASRIAGFIVNARKKKTIEYTDELVDIIKSAIPASARREGPHPAKRTFQAIRIEVNDELSELAEAVSKFCGVLADKGRFCVISFHSLEDRIVKNVFRNTEGIKKITGKPVVAGAEELEMNPRSRSAKLRVVEKGRTDK